MIAVVLDVPTEVEPGPGSQPRRTHALTQACARTGPHYLDSSLVQPSYHVDVNGNPYGADRHAGVTDPVLGAEQAFFLAVPECEQDRTSRTVLSACDRVDNFQQCRHAAGVVVRPIVDETPGPIAVAPRTVAYVVVMGSDDDVLVVQFWINAFEHGQQVLVPSLKGLRKALV